jgi:hypothetical protein
VGEARYAETQLNTLMASYQKNLTERDSMYTERKASMVMKAMEAGNVPTGAVQLIEDVESGGEAAGPAITMTPVPEEPEATEVQEEPEATRTSEEDEEEGFVAIR